jgi:holo-[acyl-carrier protein] synthase
MAASSRNWVDRDRPRRRAFWAAMDAPLIGLDLLDPSSLAESFARTPKLEETIFTAGEIAYCRSQHKTIESFAARWAAKEAVVKALGIDGFEPTEIEVLRGGAEVGLQLHGEVLARAEELGVEVSISMTHISGVAGAVALARPRGKADRHSGSSPG